MVTLCMCILGTFLRKFWSILRARDILTICEERIDENFPIVLFFPDDERLPLTSQERFVSTEFNQYDDSDDDEKIEKLESFVEWVKRKIEGEDDSDEES